MKILVTGADGFIAKNMVLELNNRGYSDLLKITRSTDEKAFYEYCREADFVYHLAGSNRPKDENEFMAVNCDLTKRLLDHLKQNDNSCPVLYASSTQAIFDNPYGRSKRAAEELCLQYGENTGAKVIIYRFPNVFGKWARPNYNSAVATFCYNKIRDIPITVSDRTATLTLVYIGDVVEELIATMENRVSTDGDYYNVSPEYRVSLGQTADLIDSFHKGRSNLSLPDLEDGFTKKLYSTYLSYLPTGKFSYPLKIKADLRGSFAELFRTGSCGQISISISKPGVTRGNHWHQTKHEKFIVVSGKAVVRLRKVGCDEVTEHCVSGEKLVVVDIPAGYTHNLENTGQDNLVTMIWVNEPYDPGNPDTYHLEV
jgi:UDP-2-acetamido-2,6-beta-L-arabino-hexul-4-ose reductase